MSRIAFLAGSLKANLHLMRDFASLLSGSVGRLVLSLAYFVCVANGLSLADFGLFATASATGVVLARIAGFGFVSPLYRAATVKKHLVGTYTAGYLAALVMSLPVAVLASAFVYWILFAGEMAWTAFAAILAAEILCWRSLEVVLIVNNGIGRFTRAAILVIVGSAISAGGAVLFWFGGDGSLLTWALLYLAANGLAALAAITTSYPRQRLRWRPDLYLRRWRDSVAVAGAEMVFFLQSELDKLLVLSLGGPALAGLYAIIMRLIDLTAIPVRAFNTIVVQKLMRPNNADWLGAWRRRLGVEAVVAFVSIAGLAGLGGFLWLFPTALGANVADAAPLLLLAMLVPAFRNLVEYQSELLYARGKTGIRVLVLVLVGLAKAGFLALILSEDTPPQTWIVALNGVFAVLWAMSAVMTYAALDWSGRKARGARFSPSLQPGE